MQEEATSPDVLSAIGRIVREEATRLGLEVEKVILFGSRARGEARPDSDYDILVIVRELPSWNKKKSFYSRVHKRLVSLLRRPVDLLVVESSWFRERSSIPVAFEAEVAEGVEIPL